MIDVLNEFQQELANGQKVVVMPVSRLLLESSFHLDHFLFLPAGSWSIEPFNISPPYNFIENWGAEIEGALLLEGESLRQATSAMTGATAEVFDTCAAIAFCPSRADILQNRKSHRDEVQALSLLSQEAESALDWIRFDFCRFDLPATLPGLVGTWNDSGSFCCAIVFDSKSGKSEIIAGEAVLHSVVSTGLGLELCSEQCAMIEGINLPSHKDGEVGGIVQHGLRLFSDVMNSNTGTSKFLRAMTLIEFLASPFSYARFQDAKKDIIVHLTSTYDEYNNLLERFRQLSDRKDDNSGDQTGYRTLMVHHGRFFEEVISDPKVQSQLWRKMQHYTGKVIEDLNDRRTDSWSQIEQFRKDRREQILASR